MAMVNKAIDFGYRDDSGCWEITSHKPTTRGYCRINPGRENHALHRFSYESFYGEIPDGLHVCHTCDNRICINPEHLFLGTALDNQQDKCRKQRQARGETSGNSKLTDEQVNEIKTTKGTKVLAEKFGVHRTTIQRVRSERTWAHK